tara:strand:+ start:786 stop:1130 length:345 start_codon:yes stop_codon:yes gene_type:complete
MNKKRTKERWQKIRYFDEKYVVQGGIKRLTEMKNNLRTLDDIAEQFNVSKERVTQWMVEFFDERYDPREERRNRKIHFMLKYLKKHGIDGFEKVSKYVNKSYKEEALKQYHDTK